MGNVHEAGGGVTPYPDETPSWAQTPVGSINGVGGNVVIVDGEGNPWPVEDGKVVIAGGPGGGASGGVPNPDGELDRIDPTWGRCFGFDADTPTLTLAMRARNVSKMLWLIVTRTSGVTGNIVIIPSVNDTEQEAVVVPVGDTPAEVFIPFTLENGYGMLSFRRDYLDERDTLQDGVPVTALVLYSELQP